MAARTMIKLAPLSFAAAALLLVACADNAPPPASSPPPPSPAQQPPPPAPGATEPQGLRRDVDAELASVDASIQDLNRRLETARDDVKVDLRKQLAALQRRDDELKVQLRSLATRADADAESARRALHQSIMDLKGDLQRFTDSFNR